MSKIMVSKSWTHTPKLTARTWKMDGWNIQSFPFGFRPIFRGELLVSGRVIIILSFKLCQIPSLVSDDQIHSTNFPNQPPHLGWWHLLNPFPENHQISSAGQNLRVGLVAYGAAFSVGPWRRTLESLKFMRFSDGSFIQPTNQPTNQPTHPPTHPPTNPPTHQPTNPPTNQPTNPPTHQPTNPPTHQPTNPPTHQPTNPPTHQPTNPPTPPTNPPTHQPTNPPTHQPTNPPTHQPTNPPTHQPTNPPTHQPTNPPTHQPTNPPTHQPTNQPTNFNDSLGGIYPGSFFTSWKREGWNNEKQYLSI